MRNNPGTLPYRQKTLGRYEKDLRQLQASKTVRLSSFFGGLAGKLYFR